MIVDSCILLDIATNDARHAEASLAALEHYQGQLAINTLVYAEICRTFIADGVLDRALAGYHIEKLPLRASPPRRSHNSRQTRARATTFYPISISALMPCWTNARS